MIPINPNKPLNVTDSQSGVVYSLRYLRDEDQEEFDRIAGMAEGWKKIKDSKQLSAAYRKYYRELINLFLVGWSGTNLEPFPESNPAEYFIGVGLGKMAGLISEKIPELIGLDTDEVKN